MQLRSGRIRALVVAPLVGVLVVSLAGCEVHAGAAATVDGSTITEKTLSSYINPTIKPLTDSAGTTIAPRTFVLQALLQEKVLDKLYVATTGSAPTVAQLAGARTSALQGATEDQLLQQVTSYGLPAKLEPILLRTQELAVLLPSKLGTTAQQQAAVRKFGGKVSVSPLYGQWNPATLTLTAFGKNQVPSVVTYTSPLPGESASSSASSSP